MVVYHPKLKGLFFAHICVLQEKMLDVYWLLRVCIRTIEHADNTGSLFAFTPEFYLNVAMNSYSALKNYFSPSNSMEELPGINTLNSSVRICWIK